jgi:hypothetical protein
MSYLYNNVVVNNNNDAFGRHRVSEPLTLGDYNHIYGDNFSFINFINEGASVTYDTNKSCAVLSTSSGSTASVLYQTKTYHRYMPGKSQLIYISFVLKSAETNVSKKVGYFDDRDGIYLEQLGDGTLRFVVRSYATGSQNNTNIPQSSWNKDKCDGTGPSKFNLFVDKTQLVFFDFQWLGVGRLRMGFVHDGELVVAHEEYHSNTLDVVYWSNPSLPVRAEIANDGTTTGSSMDFICATVMSEGGYDLSLTELAVASGLKNIATASFTLPAIAVRLKNSFSGKPNRIDVRPGPIEILAVDNNIKYELWQLPASENIVGGSWQSAAVNSAVEYNTTASGWTASGGDLIWVGYASGSISNKSKESQSPITSLAKKSFISQNYGSTSSQVFAIVVTALQASGGGCNFHVAFQWKENQ